MENYKMEDVVVDRLICGLREMADGLEKVKYVDPSRIHEILMIVKDYVDAAVPAFDFAIWSKEFGK